MSDRKKQKRPEPDPSDAEKRNPLGLSVMRELPPDDPIYRSGWIVGFTRGPAPSKPATPRKSGNKDKGRT